MTARPVPPRPVPLTVAAKVGDLVTLPGRDGAGEVVTVRRVGPRACFGVKTEAGLIFADAMATGPHEQELGHVTAEDARQVATLVLAGRWRRSETEASRVLALAVLGSTPATGG